MSDNAFVDVRTLSPEEQDRAFPPSESGVNEDNVCMGCHRFRLDPAIHEVCPLCAERAQHRRIVWDRAGGQGALMKAMYDSVIEARAEMRQVDPGLRWNCAWNGRVW